MVVAEQAPSTWERSPDPGSREMKPDIVQGHAIVMDQGGSARLSSVAPGTPLGEPGELLRLFANTWPGHHYWVMCVPVSLDTQGVHGTLFLSGDRRYQQGSDAIGWTPPG